MYKSFHTHSTCRCRPGDKCGPAVLLQCTDQQQKKEMTWREENYLTLAMNAVGYKPMKSMANTKKTEQNMTRSVYPFSVTWENLFWDSGLFVAGSHTQTKQAALFQAFFFLVRKECFCALYEKSRWIMGCLCRSPPNVDPATSSSYR